MSRRSTLALLTFTLLAADPRWLRLKSAHFEMYTTASEKDARATLQYFEQVRSFFEQGIGNIPGKALPVRIIGFNSKKEYEPYSLNSFASAYYHSSPTSEDIVLSEVGPDAFPVAVHEYVHLVTGHMGMKLPPWLGEGIAELYSTLKPMGERVLVGTLIDGRHQALLDDKWVPLKIIVNADHSSPYYNEKKQAGSLYSEGWALTHMLVLTNEYRPGFPKFLEMINAGTPTEEALDKVYGKSIAQVDKELQAYLRGTHFQGAYFAQKLEKGSDAITVEPAAPFDVKLVLTELQNRPGKEKEARAAYQQLSDEEPDRPEPYAALGFLTWQNPPEAGKNFARAFELGDRNPGLLWDYGKFLRGRSASMAIDVLSELLKQQPERTDVRLEMAAEFLLARLPAEALETIAPVENISPEDAPRLLAITAHAHLDLKHWNNARINAEKLKEIARTDDDKFQADQVLKYLEARDNGAVAPPIADPGRPRLQRKEPPKPAAEPEVQRKSVAGSFLLFDCSGKSQKVVLETAEGKKIFLIDDPSKVLGATVDLTCGPQNKDRVRIDYLPANQSGIDGLVRGIQVEP